MDQIRVYPIQIEAQLSDNLVYIENNGNYFLAGDGNKYYIIDRVGYNLNTLEINGNYSLAEGGVNNQYYIFNSNGNSIGLSDSSGNPVSSNNGYSVVQVEEGPDGGFNVLWSGPQGIIPSYGPIIAWKVDATGQYQNHVYENIDYHETTFQVDLNGGGISTLSHDNNTGLTDISGNQNYIINNSIVLKNIHGAPVGPDSFGNNPVKWNAVQVEKNAAGGFEVMWIDVGSDTPLDPLAWKTDATGTYINHKSLTTELREAFENIYSVDLDGNGRVTLETNGDYELAISGNQYQIIEVGGSSIDLTRGSNPTGPNSWSGWSATQAEESVGGGFEVLWNHSNGALSNVWKFNASGSYQSNVTNTMAQNETTFEVDLDGDGYIGLHLTSIETNGQYELARSGSQYHIIDGTGNSIDLTRGSNPTGPNSWSGWSATQAEESVGGGFEVLWNHSNGALSNVWKFNASGSYQSNVTNTMAQNETTFEVDLDGDGYIGLHLTSIETNGQYELARSGSQYHIIDGTGNSIDLTRGSNPTGPNSWSGWSATQAEESVGGGFEVLWNHSNGALSNVWKFNASGSYQSNVTNTMAQNETTFEVDLDGDGYIGLHLTSIETNGQYELARSGSQYHIIDGTGNSIDLTRGSNPTGPNSWSGWSATQAEESVGGGFEVLWNHSNGALPNVWKFNASGSYQSNVTNTMAQNETTFEVDLDGDGYIGLHLTSIETNGQYELARSGSQYHIIDGTGNSIDLTRGSNPTGPNSWSGWSATQAEESVGGGFEVLWNHSNGALPNVWKFNASGSYQSNVTNTMAQNETTFEVDLDGDGYIGLHLTSIETNGQYELARSGSQYHIIDGTGNSIDLTRGSNPTGPNSWSGWSATQAEESVGGGFEVLWNHSNGALPNVWKFNASGSYQSNVTNTMAQNETTFEVDLDGDGYIGLHLTSIETNGQYELARSGSQYHIIDGTGNSIDLTRGSNPTGPNSWSGWSATQAEESVGGGFEVLWNHSNGALSNVWKFNASGSYQSNVTNTMAQNETTFEVDLDGDGYIGLHLTSIETNGQYELARSGSQYHIIDGTGNSIDLTRGSNPTGPNSWSGWSATQAEESVGGGFEVLWNHSNGALSNVWKFNASGSYQSNVTNTMAQNETTFEVDLDGDGYIGLHLTSIETNGQYELARSGSQYHIIDGTGNSIDLTRGSNPTGPNSWSGWSATQAEESVGGGFEVLWNHSNGALSNVWKFNASGSYQSNVTNTMAQNETTFEVDLDGDGYVTISGYNGNDTLTGTDDNDQIDGGAGDDVLDGGAGKDIITTGSGSDTIYLRIGDGGNALSAADIITDFTDGSDDFGLTSSLSFGDLSKDTRYWRLCQRHHH